MNGTRSPLNVRQLRAVQISCLLLASVSVLADRAYRGAQDQRRVWPNSMGDRFSGSVLRSIGFHISTLFQQRTLSISAWWNRSFALSTVEYRAFDEACHCVLGCPVGGRHPYPQRAHVVGVCVLRTGNNPVTCVESGNRSKAVRNFRRLCRLQNAPSVNAGKPCRSFLLTSRLRKGPGA